MNRYTRVLAVVIVQLAILGAVPARQVRARRFGTPITLRTAPVDPFDVLSGHYLTLSYEVERPWAGRFEPGLRHGDEVWITVEYGDPAWTLVSVTWERPPVAVSGRVSLRARWQYEHEAQGWARIEGAQRFYVTEQRGAAVEATRRGRQSALVDLRVGADGTPAVVALRAGGIVLRDE